MPLFTPPTAPYLTHTDNLPKNNARDNLFSFYPPVDMGRTIWQDQDDNWHDQTFPFLGQYTRTFDKGELIDETQTDGLQYAKQVFLGGHVYEISSATATILTNLGYGDNINMVSPVTLTWTEEELAHLTNQAISLDGANVVASPAVDGLRSDFRLAPPDSNLYHSSRRDYWFHDHTEGWKDTHAVVELIEPDYLGTHPQFGNILPQAGVCLRAQFDGTYWRSVAVFNNVSFNFPLLQTGVFQSRPDGSDFTFRLQGVPIPNQDQPGLPPNDVGYGFEALLKGDDLYVRLFRKGQYSQPPPTSDWEISYDITQEPGDPVAIPAPSGPGTNGIIANHAGSEPIAGIKMRKVTFHRLDLPL